MGISQDAIFAYSSRNKALQELGFPDYDTYLKSELWSRIRAKVLRKSECYGCGGKPTQVHHQSYSLKVLRGENLKRLVAVCENCHTEAEFQDGMKVSPSEANKVLERIRARRESKPVQVLQKKPNPPEKKNAKTVVKPMSKAARKSALKAARKKEFDEKAAARAVEFERLRAEIRKRFPNAGAVRQSVACRMDGCSEVEYAFNLCRFHHREYEKQKARSKVVSIKEKINAH